MQHAFDWQSVKQCRLPWVSTTPNGVHRNHSIMQMYARLQRRSKMDMLGKVRRITCRLRPDHSQSDQAGQI